MSKSRWDPDDDPAGHLLERFGRVGNVVGLVVFLPFMVASAVLGMRFADRFVVLLGTGLWWGGAAALILSFVRRRWGRPQPPHPKRRLEGEELEEFRHLMRDNMWRSWRSGSCFFVALAILYAVVAVVDEHRRGALLTCVGVWAVLALMFACLSWTTRRKYLRGIREPI